VATLAGTATVIRASAAAAALKIADPIYEQDTLQTTPNSTLGITFDDQTTFSLSANTRIVIDEFVYKEGGSSNAASLNVAAGTAAFVASLVAKTGDMKITTPQATLGIRGTTGIVDVPQGAGAAAPTVKLYPDSDGHVGSIDVFDRQGGRLGALTQGSSAYIFRAGPGGRVAVVPYQIPPGEAARDRGVLQRLNLSHTIGRQMIIRRQQLRGPNNQRPGGPQPNNRRPGGQQPNNQRPGGPQPSNQRPGGQQPNNQRPSGPQLNRPGGQQPNNQRPGGPQPNRPGGQQPLNRLQRAQPRQQPPKEKSQ
jgi:FecR protein